MESYEQGYEADRFENDVSQNYHCPICLNVFRQPVMCQRNQHLFCLPCITRHLTNSQTCPSCLEGLTLETLTQAPRIVTGCLSELNIRCDYFNRGCRELVQLGDLESHVKDCGFTPVVCSNEGCLVEINRRDRTHHETEICDFRKVKCHNCAEISKEMDEVKMNLKAINDKLIKPDEMEDIKKNLKAVNDKLIKLDEMQDIKKNLKAVNDKLVKLDEMEDINKKNFAEIKEQLATLPGQIRGIQTVQEKMMEEIEVTKNDGTTVKHGVVVAGGFNKPKGLLNSVETFDWSRRSWATLQLMKECRVAASSFIYKSQVTVTGGFANHGCYDSMESMAINQDLDSAQWFDSPVKLPGKSLGHRNVVYNGRLIVIGGCDDIQGKYSDSIHEVSPDPPYTPKFLTRMEEPKANAGVELFNDRVLTVGGRKSNSPEGILDSVMMYDINKNECKEMAPLPFAVSDMATVSWGDNVIAIGGVDKDRKALNTVIIYNVQSAKSHMLPAMKYKRGGCAAVVTGNTIVAMGGLDEQQNYLKSVESFSFDRYSWEELPPMNEARFWFTAVAW